MNPRPIITVSKHSITLTPNLCETFLSYARYFVYSSTMHLNEYLQELERFKEHVPEQVPTEDSHVFEVREAIAQAQSIVREFEPLSEDMHHTFKRNYTTLAEELLKTRRELQLDSIEDEPSLKVYVGHLCQMLVSENDMFSRKKFINYINER